MILVTGAAGFIGSHVVERLLGDGHRVVGADNFDPFYARAIKEGNLAQVRMNERFRLLEIDVRDAGSLEARLDACPEACDAIIHLAARAGVRLSIADPVSYHEVNSNGTLQLLELARRRGVSRFVLASSSSVYGVNPRVPWREDDRELNPISPYASSKLAAELTARLYATLYGLRVVALRFFTVFGPRQRPDLAVAKFVRRMRAGASIPMYGDGSTRRDYTFVADIVEGVVRALDCQASPFEIINLGNHQTVSLLEVIDTLAEVFQITPEIERRPEQAGDVPRTWADVSKARELLGWKPQTSFLEGVRAYRGWLDSPFHGPV